MDVQFSIAVMAIRSTATSPLKLLEPALCGSARSYPVFSHSIRAGFPSPCSDFQESRLDLNDLLPHKEATYFAWCEGDSMTGLGLQDGDLLVIDKAVAAEMGDIVVAELHNEFTVKRLGLYQGRPHLLAANPTYPPIPIPPEGIQLWGVVIRVIHDPRPRAKRRQL